MEGWWVVVVNALERWGEKERGRARPRLESRGAYSCLVAARKLLLRPGCSWSWTAAARMTASLSSGVISLHAEAEGR